MKQKPSLLKKPSGEVVDRYRAALYAALRTRRLRNGDRAQGLGRAAVAEGLLIRDLAELHQNAMRWVAANHHFEEKGDELAERAAYFFREALIPLEAALQATAQKNRWLVQTHQNDLRRKEALRTSNRKLKREVARRRLAEELARREGLRYRTLFAESEVMRVKLRVLTRQIILAQEEERKEISRELHDEVVQTLVGINVQLAALGRGAAAGVTAMKGQIVRTQRLVENSVKAVHRFARGLRPAALDDLGLIPALHGFCQSLARRKKVKIQLTAHAGVEKLDGDRRLVLYRVAQEALTNVVRHAKATQVRVTLSDLSGSVCLEVGDNGRSFEVQKALTARSNKRLGLIGMRERVEMVGGTFAVESSPARGTIVRAEIPTAGAKAKL